MTLDVFDFDSTLFLSPLLSCNLWHSSFIDIITTENLLGPGWWRDIRSLQVNALDKQWKGFWNEDIVSQVKLSMSNPTHLTVLLTGRRYHPFHSLIESILASKGLHFDILGLRPDPDQVQPQNQFMFNFEPNVFSSTMEFKTCFLVHLLEVVPSLNNVVMWDDRASHRVAFQKYLDTMVAQKIIQNGQLICVLPAKPRYNPTWELETVQKMLLQHNEAVSELKRSGKVFEGKLVTRQSNGQMVTSDSLFKLKKIPWVPIIALDPALSLQLKTMFEPDYRRDLSTATYAEWELEFAEVPEYFGDSILLHNSGGEAQERVVQFKIIARSKATLEDGMVLQVQLGKEMFILPLWYKPSLFHLLTQKVYPWLPVPEFNASGNPSYHNLLTIET